MPSQEVVYGTQSTCVSKRWMTIDSIHRCWMETRYQTPVRPYIEEGIDLLLRSGFLVFFLAPLLWHELSVRESEGWKAQRLINLFFQLSKDTSEEMFKNLSEFLSNKLYKFRLSSSIMGQLLSRYKMDMESLLNHLLKQSSFLPQLPIETIRCRPYTGDEFSEWLTRKGPLLESRPTLELQLQPSRLFLDPGSR